jgi:hypothetical protein
VLSSAKGGVGAATGKLLGAVSGESEEAVDWENWLRTKGLWDNLKNRDQMAIRYKRLKGVRFGLIPEEQQGQLLRELLPWEEGFWYGQEAIGMVRDFEFKIPVRDPTPFCHKPIYYPPKARRWLKDYMDSLTRLGVVRKVDTLRE